MKLIKKYPLPLKHNVNHTNKIIMTKLSLMHSFLFSKKNQFWSMNWIQLINCLDLQWLVLFLVTITLLFTFFFFRSFKVHLEFDKQWIYKCFQVTEFNWKSLQAGPLIIFNCPLLLYFDFSVFSLTFELSC